ncbi:MAG TPA: response regulator [Nitrospiraceae bacterium]|nr:response regulator [Nitrospiraceae bacterium]
MATILVVDDERVFCDLLRTVLGSHGHEVFTAFSGREALDLFAQHRPQFTLLDLRMPEMNGIEVLRQIRTIDASAVVMILTAWGSDALEQQARQLGVTDFLSKTLALDTIITSMERFLPPTTQAVTPPPTVQAVKPPSPPPGHTESPSPSVEKPKETSAPAKVLGTDRILLIESDTDASRYLQQFLAKRGIHIQVASDGPTALQIVDKEMPRLIVLNMDLSGIEGLAVMRKLRAENYTGGIIMLSGTEDETLVNLAIDMGSVDILGKPLDPERLMVALQVGMLLRTKEASKMAEIRLKCPNGHEGQMTPMQTQPNEGASSPQPGWMCKVCGAIVMRCICGWPLYRDPSTLIFEDCRNPDCLLAKKDSTKGKEKET